MKQLLPVLGLIKRAFPCALGLMLLYSTTTMAADVIVVANAQVPVEHADRTELRAIYTLRKRLWSNGTPIKVFTLPDDNAQQQVFAKDVLHLYPYQLRLLWNRAVFSGTGHAPNQVVDDAAMLEAVGNTPGAIGYVSPVDELPPGIKRLQRVSE